LFRTNSISRTFSGVKIYVRTERPNIDRRGNAKNLSRRAAFVAVQSKVGLKWRLWGKKTSKIVGLYFELSL